MTRATIAAVFILTVGSGCGDVARDDRPPDSSIDAGAHRGIDLQGHRGARGLLPENSISSFRRALDLDVNTVEMDVVVTADSIVVVSHEPWFSSVICSTPQGDSISAEDEHSYNIFRMTYEEAAAFDCGSKGNRLFATQQPERTQKPRLDSAFQALERYAASINRAAPRYNVEIKSRPEFDATFTPEPRTFAQLVYDVIEKEGVKERTTVQSFDQRSLQVMREIDSTLTLALLVDNDLSLEANLDQLGFTPSIYSPHQRLVDRSVVDSVHAREMKIIPWTVNEPEAMRRLLALGVDGLITDYPDRARTVLTSTTSDPDSTLPSDEAPRM